MTELWKYFERKLQEKPKNVHMFKISISVESYDEKTTENSQNFCIAEKR